MSVNVFGAWASQSIGISIFFFDMIGTAVAALLSGLTAAVIVSVGSAYFGTFAVGSDTYALFGVVNAFGGILWAVLPRTGKRLLGADIFDPTTRAGYARLLARVLVLGSIVGFGCTLASFVIQYFILGFNMGIGSEILSTASSGSATGKNNLFLAAVLYQLAFDGKFVAEPLWVLIISLSISNIPDKIISTVAAVILIFSFSTLPNFRNQRRNDIRPLKRFINGKYVYLGIVAVFYFMVFRLVLVDREVTDAGWLAVSLTIVMSGSILFFDESYFRSVDRNQEGSGRCWYDARQEYGFKRDVFEDLLKVFVVLFTALNFWAASLPAHTPTDVPHEQAPATHTRDGILNRPPGAILIDGRPITYDPAKFDQFALRNLLVLTAFRYLIVVLMRLSGRFR